MDKSFSTLSLAELAFFEAVFRHRSLRGASAELEINKSSASRMLAHLREALDDPLFLRSHPCLKPTAKAVAVIEPVRSMLAQSKRIQPSRFFDAALLERTFRVGAGVNAALAFCLPVIERLQDIAPNVSMEIELCEGDKVYGALERGDIDLAFLPLIPLPETLHTMTIAANRLTTVVRKGHPLHKRFMSDGTLPMTALEEYPRVEVTSAVRGVSRRVDVERVRSFYAPHLQGRKVLRVPYAVCALELAVRRDMLVTLSQRAAEELLKTDPRFVRLPLFEDTRFYPVRIVWHERQDDDPAAKWLRGLFRSLNFRESDVQAEDHPLLSIDETDRN